MQIFGCQTFLKNKVKTSALVVSQCYSPYLQGEVKMRIRVDPSWPKAIKMELMTSHTCLWERKVKPVHDEKIEHCSVNDPLNCWSVVKLQQTDEGKTHDISSCWETSTQWNVQTPQVKYLSKLLILNKFTKTNFETLFSEWEIFTMNF